MTKLLAAADGFQEQGNASLIGDIIRTKITKWQMPRLMYGTQTQIPRLMYGTQTQIPRWGLVVHVIRG